MAQALWFPRVEYEARVARVREELRAGGLDLLLAFQPESVTYLTGFFTAGYTSFQFAIIPVDGDPIVVCRDVEEHELELTAAFPGRRVLWSDSDDTNAVAIQAITKAGGTAARLGVEKGAWQLTAQRYAALQVGLPRAEFVDVGHLVARHRLVKSAAEIAYQRQAARVAETAMAAGVAAAKAGASEREVAAAVSAAVVLAGSDRAHPGPLSSGDRARLLHGTYSDRVLEDGDTVHLEMVPCVHYYHARFMRTVKVGRATPEEQELARYLLELQDRAIAEVRPGVPAALPDRIYRDGILATGLVETYTNKTFYSVGLHFPPSSGEFLEAAPGCSWHFEPGMTFHTYLSVRGFAFSETILVTDDACTRLTTYPRTLLVSS